MGSALELIQNFNNPKIIDAPDSSLQEGKLHRRWKPFIMLRDFLQLPKLFIEMEDKLFSGAFKVIIWNSVSDILCVLEDIVATRWYVCMFWRR